MSSASTDGPASDPAATDLERALGVRAAGGDDGAFRLLVGRHAAGLGDLAYRVIGRRDEVDDAVQEALLRAWKSRAAYDGGHAYSTWLYRVALNVCRDRLRRLRVRGAAPPPEPTAGDGPGPLEAAERRDEAARVRAAVARLTADERELVALRVHRGLSFQEAAEVLGAPPSTLKSRMQQALAKLRRMLAEVPC